MSFIEKKLEKLGEKYLNRWMIGVFSQNNEDAIISQIFQRIGSTNRQFLEIGIGTGIECNTRALLEQGWSGTWIEGSEENCKKAHAHFEKYVAQGRLTIAQRFLTRENINETLKELSVPEYVDFLSLDIDMNTSHVWRAMQFKTRCACIEYNASYAPGLRFETEYRADSVWAKDNYFGASLETLNDIAVTKDLALVGCDMNGVNAFFVDASETGDSFLEPFTTERHYEYPWYGTGLSKGHKPGIPR